MFDWLNRLILRIRLFFARFGAQAGQWRNFDIENAEHIKRTMVEFNRSHPMAVNQPQPAASYGEKVVVGYATLLQGATGVMFRSGPGKGYTGYNTLRAGSVVAYWNEPQNGWWMVEWKDTQGVTRIGYASADFVQFTPAPIEQPPPISLPQFPSSIQEAENWREVFKSIETSMQMAQQFINEWIERARGA